MTFSPASSPTTQVPTIGSKAFGVRPTVSWLRSTVIGDVLRLWGDNRERGERERVMGMSTYRRRRFTGLTNYLL